MPVVTSPRAAASAVVCAITSRAAKNSSPTKVATNSSRLAATATLIQRSGSASLPSVKLKHNAQPYDTDDRYPHNCGEPIHTSSFLAITAFDRVVRVETRGRRR